MRKPGGFRPCLSRIRLYSLRRWLEAVRELRGCTIYVAKTKTLVAFTTQLVCTFVFAYAKIRFSHDAAYLMESHKQWNSYSSYPEKKEIYEIIK